MEDKQQTGQERETPNKWDENKHAWNSSVVLREYSSEVLRKYFRKNGHFYVEETWQYTSAATATGLTLKSLASYI
jgi:hypothetical protein